MKKYITADGLRAAVGSVLYKWLRKNRARLNGWVKKPKPKPAPKPVPVPKPKPAPKPQPLSLVMYDDINTALIPGNAQAVAGYIGGRWPTYPKVVAGWPYAKHLSVAVSSAYDADCLDVEPGDAQVSQAALWVKRQLALRRKGHKYNTKLPWVYTSASWGNNLIAALTSAGLVLGQDYVWWSAHYDPKQGRHLCSPKCYPGLKHTAQATQWTDMSHSKHLDESIVGPGLFV